MRIILQVWFSLDINFLDKWNKWIGGELNTNYRFLNVKQLYTQEYSYRGALMVIL